MRYARALLVTYAQAEQLFQAVLDHDLGEWPFESARTHLAYGTWLRRQRRITDARRPRRATRDMFDRLGAAAGAGRARQELRAAGESSSCRAPEAWDRLTPQEMQITQMVAEGLSNKEVALRLYVSHRTVATHLYRMFPKLGVVSRGQLTHAVTSRSSTDAASVPS